MWENLTTWTLKSCTAEKCDEATDGARNSLLLVWVENGGARAVPGPAEWRGVLGAWKADRSFLCSGGG